MVQPVDRSSRADDSERREHQITILTSPSVLPVGTQCQVELNSELNDQQEVVETVYEGKVAKANDDGITLTVVSERRKVSNGSTASRIPIVNRLFTNMGIAKSKPGKEKDCWIPAEKIRSVRLARHSTL
ncbi:hypothetical protein [Singulisphaera sp. GP187]|uniref:hypothetical protein n=1 Tax=Singulisphaera sp. GP187 TaxID=1882752 RepID=UPI0011610A11|nr:hypothetical protein [Singulisphaera sp. GP187]